MFSWLDTVFSNLYGFLTQFYNGLMDILGTIVYLVTFGGQVLALLVQILWQLLNILSSLGQGAISTVAGVTADSASFGEAQAGWEKVAGLLPLSAIGWALAGLVWLLIAVSAVRLLSREA